MIRPYGKKINGKTNYIIVAPHAAGDDYNTGKLAYTLAQKLDAFCVVNEMYIKPENSRNELLKNVIENFNRLPWSKEEKKYKWENVGKEIKYFFDDIVKYSNEIKNNLGFKKCIIVFIHGFKYETGIDIGIGKTVNNGTVDIDSSEGEIKFPVNLALDLQNYYNTLLKTLNFECQIGKHYNAGFMRSGVQYFDGINDLAIQFELNRFLREDQNIDNTAEILSKGLKKIGQ